ncbi:MAG: PAS domain S-box protein [Ignavibacteriae bacterium]|nr:PAS domain S-box protein [Ignavibacteriota bacterium]
MMKTTVKKTKSPESDFEKRYRDIYNTVSEAIYILNEEGVFIDVNRGAEIMYGYSREELIGMSPADVSAPGKNDLEQTAKFLAEAFNGKPSIFEFWGRRKNNEIFPKEVILNPGNYLGKKAIIATARDISERKKYEIELSKIQSRLALIFNNFPNMVLYESNGPNDFISENVVDMLGYPPYLFTQNVKFINSLVHPEYRKDLEPKILKWMEDCKSGNLKIEYPCRRADGEYIWIEDFLQKEISEDGKPYIIGMMTDISERKNQMEKLKEYAEELKNLNSSKDKFFSIIAHDLRSPFNGLLGFSTVLLEELSELTSEEIKEYAGYIHTSAKTVYNLVDNLLQWSRIQTGRIEYQPIKIDLYEEVFKAIELFSSNAITKRIKLINDIQPDVFVHADQNMLRSIMQNLISNGIKFTGHGGTIKISSKEKNERIEIEIADSGVGIETKDIAKLFRIDSQYSSLGTANEEGTGLGLILTKELVEKNRGQIWVKSTMKKGTSFFFTLPKWNK